MSFEQKKKSELVIGDVLQQWGGDTKTITHFEDHPGLDEHTARVACSGDWGITIFDDDSIRKTSIGTWIEPHLWFSWEQKHGSKR